MLISQCLPADLKLFRFVETAEEAWGVLAEYYNFDNPAPQGGKFDEE